MTGSGPPGGATQPGGRHHRVALGVVMALALGLRLWGLGFGLPNVHCRPDESTLVNKAVAIAAGSLDPHFFNYPSLQFYLLAVLYGAAYVLGRVAGVISGPGEAQRLFITEPQVFYMVARAVTAVTGTAAVALVYAIGRRLGSRRAGLLAALFLSVAFLHVRDSHFATVDVPATTYALAGCALALRYRDRPSYPLLCAAAACFGLAASTKYNLVLLGSVLLAAIWLGERRQAWRATLVAGSTMAAAFVVTTPYAVLSFGTFWRDVSYERSHFAAGHAGFSPGPGLGWLYHLRVSLRYGLGVPLLVAGMAGAVRMAWRHKRGDVAVVTGLLVYLAVAGSGQTVFARYALPMVPLLCVTAAMLVDQFGRGAVLLAIALAAPAAAASIGFDRLVSRTDTRVLAAGWLESRVHDGALVALCGSDYGYPELRLSREWLEREAADQSAAGLGARRLQAALQLEGYPPAPSYRVLEVHPEGFPPRRAVRAVSDLDSLRREGVEWVVVHEHPLEYSRPDTALVRQLEAEAVLCARLDPFVKGAAAPAYDPQDAFYVPLGGFAAVRRPGPAISVYSLRTDQRCGARQLGVDPVPSADREAQEPGARYH